GGEGGAARPAVVGGVPVAAGVQEQALRTASAVQRLHPGGPRAPGRQPPMIELAGMKVGEGQPLLLIAGPDVIESEEHALRHAVLLRDMAARHHVRYVFKCSYDKANRTSGSSFRGPGLVEGLRVLRRVKDQARV